MIENNKVTICGKLITDPVLSHELYGEKFYEATLEVERQSGFSDKLNITISERLIQDYDFRKGFILNAKGQYRSYNKQVNGKSKLMLTIFVTEILDSTNYTNVNKVELTGYICKKPVYRKSPLGREIADILIAVNRNYNKSDYIPCITWGRNAKFAGNLTVGQKINLQGRIQSREYKKTVDDDVKTLTAFEVSVSKIEEIDEFDIDFSVDLNEDLDEELDV